MAWGCVQGGGKDGCEIGQSLAAVLSPPSDKSEATIRASRKKKVEIITKMEFKEDLNQALCFLRQFQALRC